MPPSFGWVAAQGGRGGNLGCSPVVACASIGAAMDTSLTPPLIIAHPTNLQTSPPQGHPNTTLLGLRVALSRRAGSWLFFLLDRQKKKPLVKDALESWLRTKGAQQGLCYTHAQQPARRIALLDVLTHLAGGLELNCSTVRRPWGGFEPPRRPWGAGPSSARRLPGAAPRGKPPLYQGALPPSSWVSSFVLLLVVPLPSVVVCFRCFFVCSLVFVCLIVRLFD